MKLHLGAGSNYLPGFVNIDLFSTVKADVYANISALPFEPASIDVIYGSHVLEHVHRHCILATLAHWHSLLKPGGILRLAVPDFAACVAWYNKTGDLRSLIGLLYGGQTSWLNTHHIIFDEGTLSDDMRRVGFTGIERWDWRKTEHAAFDDFASASLPMDPVTRKPVDKDTGILVSLNLQGTK